MNISCINIRLATPQEWDDIWCRCEYATHYQSREWAEIWKTYTKGRTQPTPKLISFSDGKKALLPLAHQRRWKGIFSRYISNGGWISIDVLDVNHASLIADFLTRETGNLCWLLNPHNKLECDTNIKITRDNKKHVLNLGNGFDAVYKNLTSPNRRAVKKALRYKVTIKVADKIDDWQTYFKIYQDTIRRWRKKDFGLRGSEYSWEFFSYIFKRDSPNIKLWLAIYDSKIVAGVVIFYAKKHVLAWHSAVLEKYFHIRPMNLLYYEIIKDACVNGYKWFDFGSSGGLKGVEAFKESFRAEVLRCPTVDVDMGILKIIRSLFDSAKKTKLMIAKMCNK